MSENENTKKTKNNQVRKSQNWVWVLVIVILVLACVRWGVNNTGSNWRKSLSNFWQQKGQLSQNLTQQDKKIEEQRSDSETVGILSEPVKMIDVSEVVDLVSPSIVTVGVKVTQPKAGSEQQPMSMNDLWRMMLYGEMGNGNRQLQPEMEEVQKDIGSGFVVDGGNLVVTNKHVVSDTSKEYIVVDSQDNEYQVTNIYRDPSNDLAILQVENLNVPALEFGDSGALKVGNGVIAVGTALGEFRHTVTTGVVSGLGRQITASDGWGRNSETIEDLIQTDAAINSGNSGGPLLDMQGRVIGVNVAMTSGAQNIGFALPINMVKEVLGNFEATGKFERPFLGVSYQMISEKAALLNEIPQGAYLVEVQSGSVADKAGLEEGDVITSFGGESLKGDDENRLSTLINKHKVGERVEVEFYRGEEKKTISLTLEAV